MEYDVASKRSRNGNSFSFDDSNIANRNLPGQPFALLPNCTGQQSPQHSQQIPFLNPHFARQRTESFSDSEASTRPSSPTHTASAQSSARKKTKLPISQFALERISKVLVIYTGGTIGMKIDSGGVYAPKSNFLVDMLYRQPIFHDPIFAKAYVDALGLCSKHYGLPGNKSSVVRQLSESFGNTNSPSSGIESNSDDTGRGSVTGASSTNGTASITSESACDCALNGSSAANGSKYCLLTMPEDRHGRRIVFTVLEYAPLLDSSNITMVDYIKIANDIKAHYEDYAGFVVLHGTDTMAYTASALAFMLENLGKPVILTGSQIPILEALSDGRSNFLASLTLAAHYCIPEVSIFFGNKLYRGCCSTKSHTSNFSAFCSPNFPPLAEVETDITVSWSAVFNQNALEKFRVEQRMSQHVALLRLFPTLTAETIRAFCRPPLRGVVMQSYGAGNGPDTRKDIIDAIKEACERGVIFVNITQCFKGGVEVHYATGKSLIDAGVIPGYDMTPECALMKLSYVLEKDEWDSAKKLEMMQRSIRGELRHKDGALEDREHRNMLQRVISSLGLNHGSSADVEMLVKSLYPSIMCMAAKDNNVRILKSMVDMGVPVTLMDYDNRTPLHVASAHGSVDAVRFLLECGSMVHARDRFGNTPLIDSVRGRHLLIIDMLRRGGAHLHVMPTQLAHELCSLAAQNDVSSLEAWLRAGADVNAHDYDFQRPLMTAVEWNRVETVEFLLRNNADPTYPAGSVPETVIALAKRRPDIVRPIRDLLERCMAARQAAQQAYQSIVSGSNSSNGLAGPAPPGNNVFGGKSN